jgi:hypothetical protein
MWACQKCGESVEDQFDSCWKCAATKGAPAAIELPVEPPTNAAAPHWELAYRMFRGTLASWDSLFSEATAFANGLGPERVLNISHSEDQNDGVRGGLVLVRIRQG